LADFPGWAYDTSARQLRRHLADEFDITIRYVAKSPKLRPNSFDLLHVCFWGATYHQRFGFTRERIIKEVSSHRWEDDPRYGPCDVHEFTKRYLSDCSTVVCTSLRLTQVVGSVFSRTFHTPNGVDETRFKLSPRAANADLVFGWAGNAEDPVKGFQEIILPACGDRFRLVSATGSVPYSEMPDFYRKVDVFLVSSRNEGEPLTLLEAMASGCFPVCVDVGIVPELVKHRENGYIVRDRSSSGFREALEWCEQNKDFVRKAGAANARELAKERSWAICSDYFRRVYRQTLARAERPRFRNDDVSWDTSLENLKRFSAVFHKHGQTQIHGVCLHGCTNAAYRYGDVAAEYDGFDTISRLNNAEIRRLSQGKEIRARQDLVAWLNECPDEVALHGLYHTDYSKMSREEQELDIAEGLKLMRLLFPNKRVSYFIAPFNRTNVHTYDVAARHGLQVVAAEGVHLEANLDNLEINPGHWYRYHHHRFYPESQFDFYQLSIEKLEAAFDRCFSPEGRSLDVPKLLHDVRSHASKIDNKFRNSPLFPILKRVKRTLSRGHQK